MMIFAFHEQRAGLTSYSENTHTVIGPS
jgi:hypothetical protein